MTNVAMSTQQAFLLVSQDHDGGATPKPLMAKIFFMTNPFVSKMGTPWGTYLFFDPTSQSKGASCRVAVVLGLQPGVSPSTV